MELQKYNPINAKESLNFNGHLKSKETAKKIGKLKKDIIDVLGSLPKADTTAKKISRKDPLFNNLLRSNNMNSNQNHQKQTEILKNELKKLEKDLITKLSSSTIEKSKITEDCQNSEFFVIVKGRSDESGNFNIEVTHIV